MAENTKHIENESVTIDDAERRNAFIGWILYGIGMFTGLVYIAGFIWAVIGSNDTNSEFERTHYKKMKSLFLWSLLWLIIGTVTLFIIIGAFFYIGVFVWNVYVIIKGLHATSSNKNYPL